MPDKSKLGQLQLQWNLNSIDTNDAWRIISIVTQMMKDPQLVKRIYDFIHMGDDAEIVHSGELIDADLLATICQSPRRTMRALSNEDVFTETDLKDFINNMMPGDRPDGYGLTVVSDILTYAFLRNLVDARDDVHIENIVKRFFNESTSDYKWVCGRVKNLLKLFAKGDDEVDTK